MQESLLIEPDLLSFMLITNESSKKICKNSMAIKVWQPGRKITEEI